MRAAVKRVGEAEEALMLWDMMMKAQLDQAHEQRGRGT